MACIVIDKLSYVLIDSTVGESVVMLIYYDMKFG